MPFLNPFGVMMNLDDYPLVPGLLGTIYGRNLTAIFASTYANACSSCGDIVVGERGSGLRVLTIRGNGSPGVASTPITDTSLITSTITDVAARFHPAIICYGNEENSVTFYTGTAAEYRVEFLAARAAALAAGVPCANGGPTWEGVVLGAWADLIDAAQYTPACTLMTQTQTPSDATAACAMTSITQMPAQQQTMITKIRALMPVYAEVCDVGNFHWYWDEGVDPNADALATVYNWFKTGIGGKPTIINEWGVRNDRPDMVRAFMTKAVALSIPTMIYYNLQSQPAYPLNDASGNLTAIGLEFRNVITENCQA